MPVTQEPSKKEIEGLLIQLIGPHRIECKSLPYQEFCVIFVPKNLTLTVGFSRLLNDGHFPINANSGDSRPEG